MIEKLVSSLNSNRRTLDQNELRVTSPFKRVKISKSKHTV